MPWLLRLIVAHSIVSVACLGIIVLEIELALDFGTGKLLFGLPSLSVAWLMLKMAGTIASSRPQRAGHAPATRRPGQALAWQLERSPYPGMELRSGAMRTR